MRKRAISLGLGFLLVLCAPRARAAQEGVTGLRVPLYREGVLAYEIQAQTAEREERTNRFRLRGVTIRVFEEPDRSAPRRNAPPPLRLEVRGETGVYLPAEEKAELKGGVTVTSYADGLDAEGRPVRFPEAVITTDNALFDRPQRRLTSTGRVKMTRGVDILVGTDLTYERFGAKVEEVGLVSLEKDVSMSLRSLDHAKPADTEGKAEEEGEAAPDEPTNVSCSGQAIYREDDGTILFRDNVILERKADGVTLYSDTLKVMMSRAEKGRLAVSKLLATGHIRIVGRREEGAGGSAPLHYDAHGHTALYDEAGLLALHGTPEEPPVLQCAKDRIVDTEIDIAIKTGKMRATGPRGHRGRAEIHAAPAGLPGGGEGEAGAEEPVTVVTYGGDLLYDRTGGKATFSDTVELARGAFSLQSEILEVDIPRAAAATTSAAATQEKISIRRVTAREKVRIRTEDGRTATANEAVFDMLGSYLQLSGPPVPVVEQEGESIVQSARIFNYRIPAPGLPGAYTNSIRADGPGEWVVFERRGGAREEATRIVYSESMEYDEAKRTAVFVGNVVLTRGEMVLNAGRLDAYFLPSGEEGEGKKEEKKGGAETETEKDKGVLGGKLRIRQLVARQGVTMHAAGRNTSSDRMVYDVEKRVVTLLSDGVEKARVWEKNGSSLGAQRIVDTQQTVEGADGVSVTRNQIEADGPGELTLVKNDPHGGLGQTARVTFDGRCVYESLPGVPAKAVFHRRVVMLWQDMTVYGDRLDTELDDPGDVGEKIERREKIGEAGDPGDLLRHDLRKAVMSGSVRIQSLGRRAAGDVAVVLKEDESVTITGREGAQLFDERGIRLKSPRFVLYRRNEIVKAAGPGVLYIAADAATRLQAQTLRRLAGGTAQEEAGTESAPLPGEHPLDYILTFEKEMVYDLYKRRILFYQNVILQQQALHARCDLIEALLVPDAARRLQGAAGGLTLASAKLTGRVVSIRRYEPPGPDETLEQIEKIGPDPSRAGTTVLVECNEADFDVGKNTIVFSGKEPLPRILEQKVPVRGAPRRTLFTEMDKAIFQIVSGDLRFAGRRPHMVSLAVEGPLRFEE